MNSIIINVEIVAGTDFKEAVKDAKKLASIFGDSVKFLSFKFNEYNVLVSEYSDVKSLEKQYSENNKRCFIV